MSQLSKRIEIRIDGIRLERLETEARRRRKSLSALIREAIDKQFPLGKQKTAERLRAVTDMGRLNAPVGDWRQMEKEIEKGRFG